MWANCPKQWKLAYHDKLKPEDNSIHLLFGTAIHEAIQQWLALVFHKEKHKAKLFDIDGVFKDKLLDSFKESIRTDSDGKKVYVCDLDTLKEFYVDGCEILRHVKKYQKDFFPTVGYELVGCEIPLEITLTPHVYFIGYVDIIVREKKTGKIFIYDLKTSKKGWFYEKKDPKKLHQLLLYKKFYAQQFDVDEDDITVKFLILKRKIDENAQWEAAKKRITAFEPSHGVIAVKGAMKGFNAFVSGTFRQDGAVLVENLQATPSEKSCKWCPFRVNTELCPESYYLPKFKLDAS